MIKIYYAPRQAFSRSEEFILFALAKYEKHPNAILLKTQRGKPYLKDGPYISLSHTNERYFLAVSDKEVGIDAEQCARKADFSLLKERYFPELPTLTENDFLRVWTAKESASKLFGFGLSGLKKLRFEGETLIYENDQRPVYLNTYELDGHTLTLSYFEKPSSTTFIITDLQ